MAKKVTTNKETPKALSIFELEEGVVYNAELGGVPVGRTFKVVNGILKNSYGSDYTSVCSYVPGNSLFFKKELPPAPVVKILEHREGDLAEVQHFQEGMYYGDSWGCYGRKDNTLVRVNFKTGKVEGPMEGNMGLGYSYRCVGYIK